MAKCSECKQEGHNKRTCKNPSSKSIPLKAETKTKTKTETTPASNTRGAAAKKQEAELENLLNGLPADASVFPCKKNMLDKIMEKLASRGYKKVGGLGKHFDGILDNGETVELKVTKKKGSSLDMIRFQPWMDTVQFLQGQIKSKVGTELLGNTLYRAWFDKEITHSGFTYNEYVKASFDFGGKGKGETAAEKFIASLRSSKTKQKEYQQKWLRFEEEYFETYSPDTKKLAEIIGGIFESKTWWVCISSTSADCIRGPKLINLAYEGTKAKQKGGKVFQYALTLEQEGEQKTVPLCLKFHWKNGGQAVQNLNFMLV
jgi:hypothetical protein